jgi:signal transduction histidine kinase
MDFQAEKEFADIRDALNYMAGRLQTAEAEKSEMEDNRKKLIMGISHDLKTPITTVYGYAKALSDGIVTDPDKQKRHLIYIRDKAQTMAKLIDDLFKYSSIEGSEYALHLKEEDFAEFLRVLIAENYLEIENKGFNLELDIPEHATNCSFDRAEMHRALSNIIGNSIKYNPSGTTLFISLSEQEGKLILLIGDDGIGISGEIRGVVFNEFVRGDVARTSDGGSGLGLAIAKRIIEMHGGSIALDDSQSKGLKFIIVVPK